MNEERAKKQMTFRHPIESYLTSIYDQENKGFRFHATGETTLLSSCFGLAAAYLTNRLDRFDRESVTKRIAGQQANDGSFTDPLFRASDLGGHQSPQYLQWQFTFFALSALDMTSCHDVKELTFLRPFAIPDYLRRWLKEQDFDDFWYTSNLIMFVFYFFAYAKKRQENDGYDGSIAALFDFLDERQDPDTGYWGNKVHRNPENGLYGAAHIYLFYDFFGRPLNHREKIVDSTLALQLPNGLYGNWEGGACEDYDGVEVLARMLAMGAGDEKRIRTSLQSSYRRILRGQQKDGGFSYRFASLRPTMLFSRVVRTVRGQRVYRFSGWEKMECDYYRSDIWATYFRLLLIAAVERSCQLAPSCDYQNYELPAWGYLG